MIPAHKNTIQNKINSNQRISRFKGDKSDKHEVDFTPYIYSQIKVFGKFIKKVFGTK